MGVASNSVSGTAEQQEESRNVVFTTIACPYCSQAKATLKQEGVSFLEVRVDENAKLREALVAETGRKTVPVIFLNGKFIGGCDDLLKTVSEKKLQDILDSPPSPVPAVLLSAVAEEPPPERGSSGGPPPLSDRELWRRKKLEQVAERMEAAEGGIARIDVREGGRVHKAAFSGEEAVLWVRENMPDMMDESDALNLCRELQSAKLLHSVTFSEQFSNSDSLFFRLHSNEPPPSSALNSRMAFLGASRSPSEVARDLRAKILQLYDFALSKDGRSVKYSVIKSSPQFKEYISVAEELQKVDILSLPRDHQAAFWLNIYNSLIIHSMAEKGKPSSFLGRLTFYSSNKYLIGGSDFSLDDIEHGVLRGNRPGSVNLLGKRPFGGKDPRRFLSLLPRDPRIHFALNCGAKSCPPIRVFSGENLDAELEAATSGFCEGEVEVDLASKVVRLSKIFDWYKVDFGASQEERLRWLLPFLEERKKVDLQKLLEEGVDKVRVEYRTYDWGVNE